MALEDLTGATKYLAALNKDWPLNTDQKLQGDDHIRGIKNVLLNTFGAYNAQFDLSHATQDNTAETITVQWVFNSRTLFQNAEFTPYLGEGGQAAWQNAAGVASFYIDANGSAGTDSFRIFDRLGNVPFSYALADGFIKVLNRTNALQRIGWHPVQVAGGNRTITAADCGNQIFNDTTNATLTLADVGLPPDHIEIINNTSTPMTLAQGTSFLYWIKGGSFASGNRTVAGFSSVTLAKSKPNEWHLWGNGIT